MAHRRVAERNGGSGRGTCGTDPGFFEFLTQYVQLWWREILPWRGDGPLERPMHGKGCVAGRNTPLPSLPYPLPYPFSIPILCSAVTIYPVSQ